MKAGSQTGEMPVGQENLNGEELNINSEIMSSSPVPFGKRHHLRMNFPGKQGNSVLNWEFSGFAPS